MPEFILVSDEEDVSFVSAAAGPSSRRVHVLDESDDERQEPVVAKITHTSALLEALDRHDFSESDEPDEPKEPIPKPAKRKRAVDPTREAERDAERARKTREKEDAKLAKERAKADKDINKLRTSKAETLNEIHMYIASDLEADSPISAALPELRERFKENRSEIHTFEGVPSVIRFKRHVRARYDGTAKRWVSIPQPRWEWESTVVVVATAEEVVDQIHSDSLVSWAKDLSLVTGAKQTILLVRGLKAYNTRTKSANTREFTAAAREGRGMAPGNVRPSREQIDEQLVKLQVAQRVFFVHVEKTEDVEEWLFNLAADIAIRPYKLLQKAHLAFCPADGVRKGATPVATFELMLQEVQGITPSAAAGIAAEYPSLHELQKGFERAEKKGKGEEMLQDCEIRNLRDGTASGRYLNKALAKKVYRTFRGQDSLAL